MSLGERQELFSLMIAKLIAKIYETGYQVRVGDFMAKPRTPLEHKANSLHYEKCAGDLNLFQNGKFLDKTEDHTQFGAYWESLHPKCRWGGRYNDGNHYEVTA
jgi:radical SAM superfamily enzyme YgiQ (UPF0313 family)